MSKISLTSSKMYTQAVIAALLAFFQIFWLYAGLPYDFSMDLLIHHHALKKFSFLDLLLLTANPLTPAWFFMTEIGYLRPIYYLIVKFFFESYGATLIPVHICVAVGNALLCGILFTSCYSITKKTLYAWLIVLLYMSFPTNALMIAGFLSLDLQFFHSSLILCAFYAYALLTWKSFPKKKLFWILLFWFLSVWICIKWKSSEKIMPAVFLGHLLLFYRGIIGRIGKYRYLTILLITGLMFILVIPLVSLKKPTLDYGVREDANFVNVYTKKDQRMFSSSVSNLFSRTFARPGEYHRLTQIIADDPPNSFTESLGGVLGFFFWLGILTTPWTIRRIGLRGQPPSKIRFITHVYTVAGIWFAIMIAAFSSGAPLDEVRYLNFAFVPAMLLIACMILFSETVLVKRKSKIIFMLLLTAGFSITILQNTVFLVKWVGHFGGIRAALVEAEMTIHEDKYGVRPDYLELYLRHPDVERELTVTTWYSLADSWIDDTIQKITEHGATYVLTRSEDDARIQELTQAHVKLERLKSILFADAKPLMFRFYKKLSTLGIIKFDRREIIIYKATL